LFFGLFRETQKKFCGLIRLVSVFRTGTGIETTETNRTLSKQTETNRKNLQKTFSIRGSSKKLIFFLGSNFKKPKLNLFRLFFGFFFRETPPKNVWGLFRFVWCSGPVSKQPKQAELMVWGIKKVDFNKFTAASVGLLFVSVVLKH
jgi:hypothetical protein